MKSKPMSIFAAAASAAALFAASARGADLTVAQGDSVTLSDGDAYGAVVVNGNLTIPANAAVTATSLAVADGACDATVTLEPGAALTLSGDIHLGYDGGQAHLIVQSGASLTVGGNLCMAYGHRAAVADANADPTRAFLTVSNATVAVSGANGLYFYHSQYWPGGTDNSTVVDTVRLEDGSVIRFAATGVNKACAAQQSARSSTIVFAGGRIEYGRRGGYVLNHQNSAAKGWINLVSEDGAPIHMVGTNKGAASSISWFGIGSAGCFFSISGDGDIFLENTGTADHYKWLELGSGVSMNPEKPNVRFMNGGRIRVSAGELISRATVFATLDGAALRSLVLENGASFDMNGADAAFSSVDSSGGTIANSTGAACTLSVGGDDSDAVQPAPLALPSGVTFAKTGSGNLSLFASDAAAIALQGGTLSLMGRAEIGYPFYKFNVYKTSATGVANHQVKISEFKFLNGGADVTQGWDAYYYDHTGTSYYSDPTNMWDGDYTTDFYDQRDQNWSSVSNIHATLEYRPARKVTGYTWHVSGFTGGSDGGWSVRGNTPPTAWAVFGSLDNANWTRLDLVEGFKAAGQNPGVWCGTNFVCTYAPTAATIDSLSLTAGAALVADCASVAVAAVAASSGLPVTLANGATLALPADAEIASLSVDVDAGGGTLSNFRPASGGALYLTGNVENPRKCVLPIQVGTLLGGNLAGWNVYLDGDEVEQVEVFVNDDGFLETRSNAAMVIVVR